MCYVLCITLFFDEHGILHIEQEVLTFEQYLKRK